MNKNIIFHTGIEQRSPQWFALRLGKLTGSEIHKICNVRGFVKTGETYVDDKIAEICTNKLREIPDNRFFEHGRYYETVAKDFYSQIYLTQFGIDLELQEIGFIENVNYGMCGASPDGISFTQKIGLEIKCPENQSNHAKYLRIKNQYDLKKRKPEYYWQIMFCLLISGFQMWKFISFHIDFTYKKDLRIYVVDVEKDENDFDFLKSRINEAQERIQTGLLEIGVE